MKPERCDCDFFGVGTDPKGVGDDSGLRDCGCQGEHCSGTVRLYRDSAWHFKDQHWRANCLIHELGRLRSDE